MNEQERHLRTLFLQLLEGARQPRILEAGCGSSSRLLFPPDAIITGVDVSQDQLDRNAGLHEKILADVQEYRFPDESFDAIVCWDALEHLPHPERALARFVSALKSGGILLLGLPHVRSLKGWITKLTPHGLHVWVYRVVLGDAAAGKEGRAPFRTYHRAVLSPRALRSWAQRSGMQEVWFHPYRSDFVDWVEKRHTLLRLLWRGLTLVIRTFSFGRIDTKNTDVLLVLKKNGLHDSQEPL